LQGQLNIIRRLLRKSGGFPSPLKRAMSFEELNMRADDAVLAA
jgi:hypothetical protein